MIKPDNVQSYTGDVDFGADGIFRIPLYIDTVKIVGETLRNKFNGNGGCIETKVNLYDDNKTLIEGIVIPGSITCAGNWQWSPNVSFQFTMDKSVFDGAIFIGFRFANDPDNYFQTPREVAMDRLMITLV